MDALDKQYYRVRQVAEMLSLPPSTLRYWEKQFADSLRPQRTRTGTRLYTPRDVETLRMLQYLLHERGLRIEAAREHLRSNRGDVSRVAQTIDRLESVRDRLQGLLKTISK